MILASVLVLLALLVGCDGFGGPTAQVHFQRAEEFQQQGNLRAAVVEWKNVLQADPKNVQARFLLGQAYVALGNGSAAEKELERAKELGDDSSAVTISLLQALLLQNKYREIITRLKKMESEVEQETLLIMRGKAQLGLRELDKAKADFGQAFERNPNNREAQRGLIRVALGKRDFTEAQRLLDLTLKTAREDVQAWLLKGEMELSRSNFESALSAFEVALNIERNDPNARLGAVQALLAQGKVNAAKQHIDALAEANPKATMVHYFKGLIAWGRRDVEATQKELTAVLRGAPNHSPSLLLMGAVHYAKGEFGQAEKFLSRYLTAVPDHIPARKLQASVYLQLKQPALAIDTLRPAAKQAQKDPQFLAMLGGAYMSNREFEKATEHLEKAAALAPEAAVIRTQLALGHLATGDTEKGLSALESVVEMDPAFTRADLLLVFTYLKKKDFDNALSTARTLSEKQPENPVPYNLLGVAYEGKQDSMNARKHYKQALNVYPNYTTAKLNLARLDLQEGKIDSARKRYESILQQNKDHPQALVGLAKIAGDSGRFREGLELLERARRNDAKALEPRLVLADYYLAQGRPELALRAAEEAQTVASGQPSVLLVLGRAQTASGKLDDGLATLKELVDLYPQSPEAYLQLGLAHKKAGDRVSSRASLQKALDLKEDYLQALLAMGNLELSAGNTAQARKIAEDIQTKHPQSAVGYALQGDVLMAQGKTEEAASTYQRARSQGQDGALTIKLYEAHRVGGNTDEAYDTLTGWLNEHPDAVAVRLVLANAYLQDRRTKQAVKEYERVLAQHPENVVALNNLAWLYFEQGDSRALRFAEQAYRSVQQRPEILDTYGWILVHEGRVEQGLALLEKAVKGAPKSADIRYHLAAGLAKADDRAAARKELEMILQSGQAFREQENAKTLFKQLQ